MCGNATGSSIILLYCYVSLVRHITRLIEPGIIFVNVMLVVSHWKLIVHGDRLFRLELFSGLLI